MAANPLVASSLIRSGLWRRVKGVGLERFELIREPNSWTLRGTILAQGERGSTETKYSLSCDAAWRTQHAYICLCDTSGEHWLHVVADNGRWFENGRERKDLAGCMDIDLGWSPSTNTIAIRRLSLPVGTRSGTLTMAWVRFPELKIEPLRQEYERVGAHRYHYTSSGGQFRASIDIDDDGLVMDYEGVWRRATETYSTRPTEWAMRTRVR
jgi:uncharacterized protein